MRAFETALSTPWAMLPERVEELLSIAARENLATPEALEAYRSANARNGEKMRIRDNIAILDVSGPLFKKANLFVQFSGATSYEILRRDLQAALDDKSIEGIMLQIDSPGGEANGCDELAAAVYSARGTKPIHAYVSGMACSGAYWIGCAAEKMVVSDAATLGSIGVVLGVTDRTKADERNGISRIEFVSSQSPGKRPDVHSDAGKARIQKMVDDLGNVFVTAVARYRGVSKAIVIAEFGAGGVEIGANAVSKRMADEVGQFEAALKALQRAAGARRAAKTVAMPAQSMAVAVPGSSPGALDETVEQAKLAVRQRGLAIMRLEDGAAVPTLRNFLMDTNISAVEVAKMLQAAREDLQALAVVVAADPRETYIRRKTASDALGLGDPTAVPSTGGWNQAVEAANRRFSS
ncbi:signal peptide peptidase SppA [Pseudaminobacter salicylatoxidans]|uniref:Signal peptide peptidase SppA n=1 Tax=Pseudaminobacter salicylatoxidans TaxID=93369 RepID=A0A316BYN7_PSESE|nr:S49 family peptidase [Pseudaminobacter salicylatoxidans]PWJ79777.1 signal peptide peptidase SppA [Pseudaminobacter salicylatoxidans]